MNQTFEERYWAKVQKRGKRQCWPWLGFKEKSGKGYGHLKRTSQRTHVRSHVATWEIHFGPVSKGMHVLHKCDNPPCCNPAHLFLGTHQVNMADRDAKGRTKWTHTPGEKNGCAVLTDSKVREIRRSKTSLNTLAKKFGVTPECISQVRRRVSWRHI